MSDSMCKVGFPRGFVAPRRLFCGFGTGVLAALLLAALTTLGAEPASAGRERTPDVGQCTKEVSRSIQRLSTRLSRDHHRRCIREHTRGRLEGSIESCLMSDPVASLERVSFDPRRRIERACAGVPEFAQPDVEVLGSLALHTTALFFRDAFGRDIDQSLVRDEENRPTARCQRQAVRHAQRCLKDRQRAFQKCVSRGAESSGDIKACAEASAAVSCDRLEKRMAKACPAAHLSRAASSSPNGAVNHATAFAGCGSQNAQQTSACLTRATRCHHCLQLKHLHPNVALDCDQMDDQNGSNGSCVKPSCNENRLAGTALADGGTLQLDCPFVPNTTATDNLATSSSPFGMSHFAWNTFIALNWPAKEASRHKARKGTTPQPIPPVRGIPDMTKTFASAAHDELSVWETFKEKREVFHRGRCEIPVVNVEHNSAGHEPAYVYVSCSSNLDCQFAAAGRVPGAVAANYPNGLARVQNRLGQCVLESPPFEGICSGSRVCDNDSSTTCTTNANCGLDGHCIQTGCTARNVCSNDFQASCTTAADCTASTGQPAARCVNFDCPNNNTCEYFHASTGRALSQMVCSNTYWPTHTTDQNGRVTASSTDGANTCTTYGDQDSACMGTPYSLCIFDPYNEHIQSALKNSNNPAPPRSAASREWSGFPRYTPQGSQGDRITNICSGFGRKVASLGHDRYFASPAKHVEGIDESVEVLSESREGLVESCKNTKWCATADKSAGRTTCQKNEDCPNGSCVAVGNTVEEIEKACLSQLTYRCSEKTEKACGTANGAQPCGAGEGECIRIQKVANPVDAPPCCRARASAVAPRIWKGDPAAGKHCAPPYPPSACTKDSDCGNNGQYTEGACQAGPNTGRPVFYEVRVNHDYFNYIMNATHESQPLFLDRGLDAAAHHGDFILPSRTSDPLSSTPQNTRSKFEVWGYDAEQCLRSHGHARVCSNDPVQACTTSSDCRDGGTCGESRDIPCRSGTIQTKAAWLLLTPAEIASKRYKTAEGLYHATPRADKYLQNRPTILKDREGLCTKVGTFGLVGLHIIQRTHQLHAGIQAPRTAAQVALGNSFVFATWEHKDNDTGGFRYANHYEGVGENRADPRADLDEVFVPDIGVVDSALHLNRLTDLTTDAADATTHVNNQVHNRLGCTTLPLADRPIWCNYRLIGIQYAGTNHDEHVLNGRPNGKCYAPNLQLSMACSDDSHCINGQNARDQGTCVPIFDHQRQQDYTLANLMLESNLGLQYFKGLPAKVSPPPRLEQFAAGVSGKCQSDPRLTCSGGQCEKTMAACHLDSDCHGGNTCTQSCTSQKAPVKSVCLNSVEFRCEYDHSVRCNLPGISANRYDGGDDACGTMAAAAGGQCENTLTHCRATVNGGVDSDCSGGNRCMPYHPFMGTNAISTRCLSVPKICSTDAQCRGKGPIANRADRFPYDICLNHCAPSNSNTLRPMATSPAARVDQQAYRFRIEPRQPIPYSRTRPNMRYAGDAKNMGGCMGCHGVADTAGFSFSFVALDGQGGVTIQTSGSFDISDDNAP